MDQWRTCKHVKFTEKFRGRILRDLRAQWKVLRHDAKSTVCESKNDRPAFTEIKRFLSHETNPVQREKKQTTVSVACTCKAHIWQKTCYLEYVKNSQNSTTYKQSILLESEQKPGTDILPKSIQQVTNGFMKKKKCVVPLAARGNTKENHSEMLFLLFSCSVVSSSLWPHGL